MHDDARTPGHVTRTAISRRRFGQVAAAAALTPVAMRADATPRAGRALHVGLIGCGGRGTGAAAQALQADPDVVITALADVFPERTRLRRDQLTNGFGDRVQVPDDRCFDGFDCFQRLIDTDVDVVLLASPPAFRPAQLDAASRAGKHIFCEKPMAVDAPGVRTVLDAARRCEREGLSLVSGFCWRYHEPERVCFREVHGGRIGEIRAMHSTYHSGPLGRHPRQPGWSDVEWQVRNWWHFTWLSGDHLVEQAVHSVDKINWAMQNESPKSVVALGGRGVREGAESGNVFDHFTVIYEYANGARAFLTARQQPNCANDNTDMIYGTAGDCFINGWGPTHRITGEHPWTYDGPSSDMYQTEHDELFASIRTGTPINDGEWMARSTMMAIAGRMSAYTGRQLSWEDACASTDVLGPDPLAFGAFEPRPIARPGSTPFV